MKVSNSSDQWPVPDDATTLLRAVFPALNIPPAVHDLVHPVGWQGCSLGHCPDKQPQACFHCGAPQGVCVDWVGHAGVQRGESGWWRAGQAECGGAR